MPQPRWTPAGERRHRITIEQNIGQQEPTLGAIRPKWIPFATIWTAINPTTGREAGYADQTLSISTHRLNFLYLPGVTSKMRINFKGRYFAIQSLNNIQERNREIELMATETPVTGSN